MLFFDLDFDFGSECESICVTRADAVVLDFDFGCVCESICVTPVDAIVLELELDSECLECNAFDCTVEHEVSDVHVLCVAAISESLWGLGTTSGQSLRVGYNSEFDLGLDGVLQNHSFATFLGRGRSEYRPFCLGAAISN